MTNREMVCGFLELPTHVQFEIGRDLGLPPLEWQADNTEGFRIWFQQAKERDLLETLRNRVEGETP